MNRLLIVVFSAFVLLGCSDRGSSPPQNENVSAVGTITWGTLSGGLQCNVALTKTAFAIGEDITVFVQLRNSSKDTLWVPGAYYHVDREYGPAFRSGIDPVLVDSDGDVIEPKSKARFKASEAGKELRPNEKVEFSFDLTDWYQLQKTGQYLLHLAFTKQYSGFVEGRSNSMTFELIGSR